MLYLLHNQETTRLHFREILPTDFDTWLEFHKDPLTSVHWNEARESPETECIKWYDKQFHRYANNLGGMNALVEKASGKLIGHCGLLVQQVDGVTELEIGYSLLREFWHRGFATEAALKCKTYAFENNFAQSLISIISVTNIPSEKVAIKNGMSRDGITVYSNNSVTIFRITYQEWLDSKKSL
jgi:[ribosomal protein S5]-alanine N-acetyltransferase